MAEQILKTRIQLKYDTYANWIDKNPVLKKGEMALAAISSGNTQEVNSIAAPQVLIKVGDGISDYKTLPFVSAKAADVYSWAKKEGIEIITDGSGNTITDIAWDESEQALKITKSNRVASVAAADESITIGGTAVDPTLSVQISAAANNQLSLAEDGLYVKPTALPNATDAAVEGQYVSQVTQANGKINVTRVALPSYTDTAVEKQFVTQVNETNGQIEVSRSSISYNDLTDLPTIPTGFAIETSGTDDDVVVLDVRGGINSVAYYASHAKKGPSTTGSTTKGATEDVTIEGYSGTGTIKVPEAVVDQYGHVTGLTEQTLTITMPEEQVIPDIVIAGPGTTSHTAADEVSVLTGIAALGHNLTVTGAKVPTKQYVDNLVAANMVFKGTVGTGGTVTALPTADASTLGDMYKVVTAGTYASTAAKVGDTFICYKSGNSYSWVLIPSGDDVEDTWRVIKVNNETALQGGITTGALTFNNGTTNGTFLVAGKAVTVKGIAENADAISALNTLVSSYYVHKDALNNYATTASVTEALKAYTTTEDLAKTYATIASLDSYVTTNTLTTTYYTKNETQVNVAEGVAKAIGTSKDASTANTIYGAKKYAEEKAAAAEENAKDWVETNYVSNDSLTTTLADYVTTDDLDNTLASYVTNTGLNTTLASYVTNDTLTSNYYTTASVYEIVQGAITIVQGGSKDTSDSKTVAGAKKYADEKAAAVIGTANDAATTNTIYGVKKYAAEQAANAVKTTFDSFEGRQGLFVGYDSTNKTYYAQFDPSVVFVYDCGNASDI